MTKRKDARLVVTLSCLCSALLLAGCAGQWATASQRPGTPTAPPGGTGEPGSPAEIEPASVAGEGDGGDSLEARQIPGATDDHWSVRMRRPPFA